MYRPSWRSPSRWRFPATPMACSRSTVPCSRTPALTRSITYSRLRFSTMTESMPLRCSRCPSMSPAGPAPMMPTCVRIEPTVGSESGAAREVRRVIGAAAALVLRDERIRAQRPRPCDRSTLIAARGRQRFRRLAVLHPGEQRLHQTGRLRTGATGAMRDTGRHEESNELRRLLRAAHLLLHARVVVDAAFSGDQLVGPSVPDDDLAAAIAERREVGIIGRDHIRVLLH